MTLLRTLGVALALATVVPALPGCGSPDAESGDEQNQTAAAGRFETFVGADKQHYFQLLAGNGERVLRSEGYSSLANAKKGIASVQKNGVNANNFELLAASDGETYFNLVSPDNGQVIATSETYSSKSNAKRAVKTVSAILKSVTTAAAPTGSPKFETFEGQDGQDYFRLRAKNGEVVLQSEGYSSASAAKKGIDAVKKSGIDAGSYEILEAQDGQHYFRIVAANGEVIARGETYLSLSNAERGAEAVQRIVRELGGAPDRSDKEVQSAIEKAAEGAIYVSESDEEYSWVFADIAADAEITEELVRDVLAKYVDESEEADGPLADLVGMTSTFTEWKSDSVDCSEDSFPGPEECAQTRELNDALGQNLTGVKVFYFGRDGEPGNVEGVAVTIFVIGRTPAGNLAGVRTLAIWT